MNALFFLIAVGTEESGRVGRRGEGTPVETFPTNIRVREAEFLVALLFPIPCPVIILTRATNKTHFFFRVLCDVYFSSIKQNININIDDKYFVS